MRHLAAGARVALLLCACMVTTSRAAITFTPGNFYATGNSSRTITQYNASGGVVGSLTIPSTTAPELRGLAFGSDNYLYAVSPDPNLGVGFSVLALDAAGAVHASYHYTGSYLSGDIFHGKITFDQAGHFYVGGLAGVVRFDIGQPNSGTLIVSDSSNGIFDMAPLPSGNLVVVNAYSIYEVTSSGSFVRKIGSQNQFVDLCGVTYDPTANIIYATELNIPNIMKLDGTTGTLLGGITFGYANDINITRDGRLVVTSRTQVPAFFSKNLTQLAAFGGTTEPLFIAEYVPEPAAASLALVLAAGIVIRKKTIPKNRPSSPPHHE